MAPYRDEEVTCPSCKAPLRAFHTRLCCDACNGIFLDLDDLTTSIIELTGAPPEIAFAGDHPSKRACPRCAATMVDARLDIQLGGKRPKLHPVIARCDAHGVWFETGELAQVLSPLHGAITNHRGNWYG